MNSPLTTEDFADDGLVRYESQPGDPEDVDDYDDEEYIDDEEYDDKGTVSK